MRLPDGGYVTRAGSLVTLSRNGGASEVEFDWLEEPGACCDCQVDPYPDDGRLTWGCDSCEGGSAELWAIEPGGVVVWSDDMGIKWYDHSCAVHGPYRSTSPDPECLACKHLGGKAFEDTDDADAPGTD